MAKFNPYQAWLGVTSNRPSYYELVGLPNFESEPPVIAEAVDTAVQKVGRHRSGEHREAAEKVLRELEAIKGVLLSASKRQAYDAKLRGAAATSAPVVLPPGGHAGVDATESPTMMLPPGALPPMGMLPPGAGLPQSPAYGGYPGAMPPQAMPGAPMYPPGYAPPAAAPYGAPGYGAPSYGMPPTAAPPAGPSMFPDPTQANGAGFLPSYNFGPPEEPAPSAMPGYGVPALPPAAGHPPTAAAAAGGGVAVASTPAFTPRQTTPVIRRSTQRRQRNSSLMLGIAVLGGAVGLLVVAMVIANKSDDNQQAAVTPTPAAQPAAPVAPAPQPQVAYVPPVSTQMDRDFPDGGSIQPGSGFPGSNVPSSVDVAGEMSRRDRRADDLLKMDNLIPALIPGGATPTPGMPTPTVTATTGMPTVMPTPSATVPSFNPPPAMPTPSPTAMPSPTATPAPAPQPVVIAMATTERPQMEAALPADAARGQTVRNKLKAVVTAWKARNYPTGEEIALESQVLADTPELINLALDYYRGVELLHMFWNGVRAGAKSLQPGDVLKLNGNDVNVVRQDETSIVIEQNKQEVPLNISKLIPSVAVQVAAKGLGDEPSAKLAMGLFLGIEPTGDKAEARRLLGEAGDEGAPLLAIIEQAQ